MPDASDTFRLGLDADDRPEPSYPGDGIGDGQPEPTEPVLVVAPILAAAVAVGDLISEIDTPDGPFYEVLAVEADGFTVDGRASDDDEPLPVPLEVGPRDRVLVRRPAVVDPASDTADLAIDPDAVTVAPSGRFGFYSPARTAWEATDGRPLVAVAQVIARAGGMEFHPTPARYFAETIAALRPGTALAIDYGQGWSLSARDTDALTEYARAALAGA